MYKTIIHCPVCGSNPAEQKFFERSFGKIWNDKLDFIPLFYGICTNCGVVFQMLTIEDADHQYMHGDYRKSVQHGSAQVGERIKTEQSNRAENLMPQLDLEEVKSVLDIGSSTGLWLEALKERYDCEVLGIEPGEAQRMSSAIVAFSDISLLDNSYLNSFDLITIIHVLEHLDNPTDYLTNLHNFITDGGHLLVEVPSLYNEFTLGTFHPTAFNMQALKNCLNLAGWEIVWEKEYPGIKGVYPNPANLLVLAKPGKFVEELPSVDIDEILNSYNAGQEELRKFTQSEGSTGEK
jgi:SAM-dependent methyltransferase